LQDPLSLAREGVQLCAGGSGATAGRDPFFDRRARFDVGFVERRSDVR